MGRKKLSQTGVPIALYKQGLEQHIGRAISEKEFSILYSGWAYRYAVVTDHNVRAHTPMEWKRKGYIPREAADNLSNYLITGWRITGDGGRVTGYGLWVMGYGLRGTGYGGRVTGDGGRGKDECGHSPGHRRALNDKQ